jgi:hypothetical protein
VSKSRISIKVHVQQKIQTGTQNMTEGKKKKEKKKGHTHTLKVVSSRQCHPTSS